MLWSVGILVISNVPIILFHHYTNDTSFFYKLSWDQVFLGTKINLLFLGCWIVGFVLANKLRLVSSVNLFKKRFLSASVFFLGLTGVAYIYYYTQNYSYGFSNELYGSNSSELRSFGVIGSYKNLFLPFATAGLIVYYNRRKGLEINENYKNKILKYFFWVVLLSSIFVGAIYDLQRGDIVRSILYIAIIALYKGIRIKKIIYVTLLLGVALFALSPIFDILRLKGFYNKEVSIENLRGVFSNERALRHARVGEKGIFSLENVITQLARKNVLPKSTAALKQYADREGHVYFRTYATIPYDLIPRFIFPNKPVTLSIDETKGSMAAAISGREIGLTKARTWESGGGNFYWQFSWLGVILGGCIMGALWCITIKYAFYGKSFFFLVIVLGFFNWGQFMILSLDNYFVDIIRGFKGMLLFWAIYIIFLLPNRSMTRTNIS